MPDPNEKKATATEAELKRITKLLGGKRKLKGEPRSQLEAHEIIRQGIPTQALLHLRDEVSGPVMKTFSFEMAVGVSPRTVQRLKAARGKRLSTEQSSRIWKFAEILAKATEVFGSQAEAEQWLERPAIGLNQNRPIDLLATAAGVELVEDHLRRLEYGVYT